jgi:hypothetical protein
LAYAGGDLFGRDGGAWRRVMYRDGAGGLDFLPLSDSGGVFQPVSKTAFLAGMVRNPMVAALDAGGFQVTNAAAGSAASHLVTKAQLDVSASKWTSSGGDVFRSIGRVFLGTSGAVPPGFYPGVLTIDAAGDNGIILKNANAGAGLVDAWNAVDGASFSFFNFYKGTTRTSIGGIAWDDTYSAMFVKGSKTIFGPAIGTSLPMTYDVFNGVGIGTYTPTAVLDVAGTGSVRFRSFTTAGNLISHDASGYLASILPSSLPNIYSADGTLAANRTINTASLSLALQSATSGSPEPFRLQIPMSAGNVGRLLVGRDTSAVERFRIHADGTEVQHLATGRNLKMKSDGIATIEGATESRIVGGSNMWRFISNGTMRWPSISGNPGSFAQYDEWLDAVTLRRRLAKSSSVAVSFATLEDDMIGEVTTIITASSASIGGTKLSLFFDCAGGSQTQTLGSNLAEGVIYLYRIRNNGTNTLTWNAEASYSISASGINTVSLSSLVCGAGGTGVQAPFKTYVIRRVSTVVHVVG